MNPFLIPIVAISVGGVVAITYMVLDFVAKIHKAKAKAQSQSGEVSSLTQEVERLKVHNQKIQRRIENLEAIVVDRDMENLRSEFTNRQDIEVTDESGQGKNATRDMQF